MSGIARTGMPRGLGRRSALQEFRKRGVACHRLACMLWSIAGVLARTVAWFHRCTRIALRYTSQRRSRLAVGPTDSLASGKVRDDEARIRNPGSGGARTVASAKPAAGLRSRCGRSIADNVRHGQGHWCTCCCRHLATVVPADMRRPVRRDCRSCRHARDRPGADALARMPDTMSARPTLLDCVGAMPAGERAAATGIEADRATGEAAARRPSCRWLRAGPGSRGRQSSAENVRYGQGQQFAARRPHLATVVPADLHRPVRRDRCSGWRARDGRGADARARRLDTKSAMSGTVRGIGGLPRAGRSASALAPGSPQLLTLS